MIPYTTILPGEVLFVPSKKNKGVVLMIVPSMVNFVHPVNQLHSLLLPYVPFLPITWIPVGVGTAASWQWNHVRLMISLMTSHNFQKENWKVEVAAKVTGKVVAGKVAGTPP